MPTIIAIVIALIAVAVAIAAWFRPAPKAETPAAKTYSEQEIADAKKAVCDAFGQTQQTLKVTGSKASEDPTQTFIIAINSRVAIETASSYLHSKAQSNQAAPKDVAEKVTQLADIYRVVLLKQLADATRDDLKPLYDSLDASTEEVTEACK